jgi:hypothetical protein
MKIVNICAALVALALSSIVLVAPVSALDRADAPNVRVPAGTAVSVHIVGTLSSASAKAGDSFVIQVAKDVVIGGLIVVPAGAGGAGHVVNADSAGGNGHSGSLALALDYVDSADGRRIELAATPLSLSEEDRTGAKSTATIVGVATLGLGGLFAHNLAHGRQKTLDEKTILTGFVARTVRVRASERIEEAIRSSGA